MSKVWKIGILGAANIAKRHMIPAIQEHSSFHLAGIASRNPKRINELKKSGNFQTFKCYDELLKTEIDAVYIPLPNSEHFQWVKAALNCGKHVLVEKSLGISLKEVSFLCDMARAKNCVLLENFQFRFHSQLNYILEKISSGDFGQIRNIRSSFGFPPFEDKSNIRYNKDLGGGALLDAGAYPIKVTQIILGSDLEVESSCLYFDPEIGVDIYGSAVLKSVGKNVVSQIAFGFDNFYQNNLEIWTQFGFIRANRIFTAGPGVVASVDIYNEHGHSVKKFSGENHFVNMLDHFSKLIAGNASNELEYLSNVKQADLIEKINVI